jgi:hypothetical protein
MIIGEFHLTKISKNKQMNFVWNSLLFCCVIACFISCKQTKQSSNASNNLDSMIGLGKNPYVIMDQSPMDMIFLPVDYPVRTMQLPLGTEATAPVARIIYSRPHRKGRTIFGADSSSLCQYGKEWRLGANEATEISLFRTVNINGENIGPGVFTVFCIPEADSWEIIFNSNTNIWGLNRNPTKDVFKVQIPTKIQNPTIEDFTMSFRDTNEGGILLMAWDDVKAELPLLYMR